MSPAHPDPDAPRAVRDGLVDGQIGERRLLARHDHVDVVLAAQAVVRYREQGIGVRREVDTDDLRLLVHHVIDEAGVLVRKPVVVLPPDMRCEQVVQRCDRPAPRNVASDLEPFRVLVEHRVDDVDERLVTVEEPMAAREQIALEPALAHVLAQNLHHAALARKVIVPQLELGLPDTVGRLEHRTQPVGDRLVGTHEPEVVGVACDHVAQVRAQDPRRLAVLGAGPWHLDGVIAKVGQAQFVEQLSTIGVRVGAHAAVASRRQRGQVVHQPAGPVEQLLRSVAPHPVLEDAQVIGFFEVRDRNLVGAEGALDRHSVDDLRSGPALGSPQHDHRPARP